MGRNTFETVIGFDMSWPYANSVFVLSKSLKNIPKELSEKVDLVSGPVDQALEKIHNAGFTRLYIDGGIVIQRYLEKDLIDEMIITKIPILLGGGVPLFGPLENQLEYEHIGTEVLFDEIVKYHYQRKR